MRAFKNIPFIPYSIILGISCLGASPSFAQTYEKPSIASFNAENGMDFFEAPSLRLSEVGTIEFWASPKWNNEPDGDPVILSATGFDGPHYSIVMTGKRDAIGLYSGDDWDFIEYDFSQDKLYHIAFLIQGDLTDIYIDGEMEGSIAQGVAPVDFQTFHIGSADGFNNVFVGDLAGIRIWDGLVDPDDLNAFHKKSLIAENVPQHPDLESLRAISDFTDGKRNFILTVIEETDLLEDETVAEFEVEFENAEIAALFADEDPTSSSPQSETQKDGE